MEEEDTLKKNEATSQHEEVNKEKDIPNTFDDSKLKSEETESKTSEATKGEDNEKDKEKKLTRMGSIRNKLKKKDKDKDSSSSPKDKSDKKSEKKRKEEEEKKRKEQEKAEKKRAQEAEKKRKDEEKKRKKLSDDERKKLRDDERKKRQDERKNEMSNNNGNTDEDNPITISINGETSPDNVNTENNNTKKPRVIKLTPGKQIQINGYTKSPAMSKKLDDGGVDENATAPKKVETGGGVAGKASAFASGDLYWNNNKKK